LGSSFENYRSSPNIRATFFYGKSYVLVLTKRGVEPLMGRFFSQTHLVTLAMANQTKFNPKLLFRFVARSDRFTPYKWPFANPRDIINIGM
jgi:hypothetical protein